MTDYDYDTYCEVMEQALKTMNELLDSFELRNEIKAERTDNEPYEY